MLMVVVGSRCSAFLGPLFAVAAISSVVACGKARLRVFVQFRCTRLALFCVGVSVASTSGCGVGIGAGAGDSRARIVGLLGQSEELVPGGSASIRRGAVSVSVVRSAPPGPSSGEASVAGASPHPGRFATARALRPPLPAGTLGFHRGRPLVRLYSGGGSSRRVNSRAQIGSHRGGEFGVAVGIGNVRASACSP